MRAIDIRGMRFGMLVALERVSGGKHSRYLFQCDCGTQKTILASHVRRGNQVSCGCYGRIKFRTHGFGGTPEYKAWHALVQRCTKIDHPQYPAYGGRGIKVCDRWLRSFEAFLDDVGLRPSRAYSIDRIDNDGDYEPGNCRWATKSQQRQNQRQLRRKRLVTFRGRSMMQSEWAAEIGISRSALCVRLKNWPLDKALTLANSMGRHGNKTS